MSCNTAIRLFVWFSIAASIAWLGKIAYDWKSPGVNQAAQRSIHQCIHDGPHNTDTLTSMGHLFIAHYVEHTAKDCINPHFPLIHISTNEDHNAWLHIVRTDCRSEPKLRQFVDAADEVFPLYTLQQDFYDAPCWSYTLFSKPLSFWIGHAYAVRVDHENKTIRCIGGVEWGFKFSYLPVHPQMIFPRALALQDWQEDWPVFKTAKERMLFDYTDSQAGQKVPVQIGAMIHEN